MINFFGKVHSDGGCGRELLGAIELLRSRNVPVRLISPAGEPADSTEAADYLRSIGVELASYEPGIFGDCAVLMSFAEGEQMFFLIRENKDRPRYLVYSDCMHFVCDNEVDAYRDGLIDEFFFQTRRMADRLGPQIARRAQKSVFSRKGYKAFINPSSDYLPIRFSLEREEKPDATSPCFGVLKVSRDHEEKWHPDTWRMFCGINAPFGTKVQIEVAGWGPEAAKKVGDISHEANPWHKQIDIQLHTHVYDPKDLATLYRRSHVLVHVCDYAWEECMSRVMLEAIISGVVVISDKRGGALDLIRHGESGFLVDSPDEAAYYASRMAFEPNLRKALAGRAYAELVATGHGNSDACFEWWKGLIKKSASVPQPTPL